MGLQLLGNTHICSIRIQIAGMWKNGIHFLLRILSNDGNHRAEAELSKTCDK